MSLAVQLIRLLQAEGMSADRIIAVVDELHQVGSGELVSAYEHGPSAAAIRQKRYRDKKKASRGITNDATQDATQITQHKEKPTPIRNTSSSEAKASSEGADAPIAPRFENARQELFFEGKAILIALGVSKSTAGSMIGLWLKQHRDDAVAVMGLIHRAREAGAIEPVGWITRAIATGPPNGRNGSQSSQKPSAYETAKHIAASLAATQPEPPARGGPGNDDDRLFQAGQRGLSPPSGDGDYLDASPVSARSY